MRVWISHSSDADAFALKLRDALREHNVEAISGLESIRGGEAITDRIMDEVMAADVVVLVISARTAKSFWVSSELASAMYAGKRILPVKSDSEAEVPYLLRQLHYIDLSAGKFDEGVELLLKAIKSSPPLMRAPSATLQPLQEALAQLERERHDHLAVTLQRRMRLASAVAASTIVSAFLVLFLVWLFYESLLRHLAVLSITLTTVSSLLTAAVAYYFGIGGARVEDDHK